MVEHSFSPKIGGINISAVVFFGMVFASSLAMEVGILYGGVREEWPCPTPGVYIIIIV